jgi:hypothetical protein
VPNLENLTPYSAISLPSMAPDGTDLLLVVVSGRFDLPPAGRTRSGPPKPSEEQKPVQLHDEYNGEPDSSSLRYEGQSAPLRLATDVHIVGQAWAPKGVPTKRVDVALVIPNRLSKTVAVFGERVYTQTVGAVVPTAPRPFTSMPLVWERAFGGAEPGDHQPREFEPRNPVGRGFFKSASQALNQPVPNLEDPRQLINTSADRPTPMGFGPIARSWYPRVRFAGTYDQRWLEELAPNWPPDFDPRFFNAAPPDLQLRPHLSAGEMVGVSGVAPDGDVRFSIPPERLLLKSYFQHGVDRRLMLVDSLLIEPDDAKFTVTWRSALPLPHGMFEHELSIVRVLQPWEDPP